MKVKKAIKSSKSRCESCSRLVIKSKLKIISGDSLCPNCFGTINEIRALKGQLTKAKNEILKMKEEKAKPKPPSYQWYAIAVVGSDNRVRTAIKQRLKSVGVAKSVRKLIIPRERVATTTSNRYEAFDIDGKLVGTVTADDADIALKAAKARWEKIKGGKGAWNPQATNDHFSDIEKVESEKVNGRLRNVFTALSNTGRVMGKIYVKTWKEAWEQATKLYANGKPHNPREAPTQYYQIKEVRLERKGGDHKLKNKRAMPGYILVEMKEDSHAFDVIQRTPGVQRILPWREKVDYEDIIDPAEDTTDRLQGPTSISDTEIRKALDMPLTIVPEEYKVGDQIRVIDGQYEGIKTVVEHVNGTTVRAPYNLMGRPIFITIPLDCIRKEVK